MHIYYFFQKAILPTFELIAFSLKIFLPIAFTTETVFYIIYTAIPLYFIPVRIFLS
jgi:hypothetical protein